jgi:hypothetical protein
VLYVTVGKSDRQTASAVVRSERTKAVPDVFRDYAAQVIADGAVSLYEIPKPNQDTLPDNKREFVRKSWDYPSTDWDLRTYQTDATKRSYFKPSGHLSGSTPFLASPTPTWLDFAGSNPPDNIPEHVHNNYNDWGHISNFAPDGAFDNLWNLRPEANFGGFDAPTYRMRTNVGLLSNSFNVVSNSRDFNNSSIRFAAAGLPGNPADLSMRQAWLFREVKLGNNGAVGPDNPAYMPYQYADVDGDGKYDSRIFELREYRDASSFAFKDLLPQDPNFRWFFAARCVDLSGMVNVNTATDYFEASARGGTYSVRAELPSGVTPAEVNLFRLLTLQDAFDLTGDGPLNGSYASLNQNDGPRADLAADVQNYARPRSDGLAIYTKDVAYNIGARAYDSLLRSFTTNTLRTVTTAPVALYLPDGVTRLSHYVNLAGRRNGDSPAGSITLPGGGVVQGLQNTSLFTAADQMELLTYWGCNDPETMSRLEAVMSARENRQVPGSFAAASADRDPLRSNRSLPVERDFTPQTPANPQPAQNAARLQAEIDIRHQITTLSGAREIKAVPVPLPASNSVSDLLSGSDANTLSSAAFKRSPQTDLEAALTVVPVANGQKTSDALEIGRIALNDLFTGYADGLMPTPPSPAARAEVWRGAPAATIPVRNKNRTRFYGYSWYDGPELPLLYGSFMTVNLADMYDTDDAPTVRTVLFNDQFRPELTADFRNAQSRSGSPLDEAANHQDANRKPLLISDRRGDGTVAGSRAQPWSGWADLKQLDLNNGEFATGRLANTNQYSTSTKAPALNVYGIEATPMITQVATVTVYTDAPSTVGGDSDGLPDNDGDGFPDGLVTIKTDPLDAAANTDFVMRVAAFQISNPFEKDIILSATGGAQPVAGGGQQINGSYIAIDSEKSFYYLEFAGHFYKLAELRTPLQGTTYDNNGRNLRPLTVPAGGSIVVYVLDRPKSDVLSRMQALSGGAAGMTAAALDGWFTSRFGGSNSFVCEVPEFKPIDVGDPASNSLDPATGGRVIFTPHDPCGDATIVANSDPRKDPKRNALLWRAMRAENFQGAPTGSAAAHEGTLAGANYYQRNSRVNDQLADRFTATTDLDRKYAPGNVAIAGAFSGTEGFLDDTLNHNYNTGMTISLFQSSRRPDSPANPMPIGAIPAWAIKPVVQGSTSVWAVVEDDDRANIAGSPAFGDFQKPVADYTFMGWFTKTSLPATNMLPKANVAAAARTSNPVETSTSRRH